MQVSTADNLQLMTVLPVWGEPAVNGRLFAGVDDNERQLYFSGISSIIFVNVLIIWHHVGHKLDLVTSNQAAKCHQLPSNTYTYTHTYTQKLWMVWFEYFYVKHNYRKKKLFFSP